jgi:5-formyltetrahydrofolate cyclo-ligase
MCKEWRKKRLRGKIRGSVADAAQDVSIWSQVEDLPEFKAAGSVLLYWSMASEVDTHAFAQRWYDRKKLYLPKVSGESLEIREYIPDDIAPGYRGIMEPSDKAPVAEKVDLVIVPGMAFDARGNRLGRGGGFYDRLLPSLSCPKVGVCRRHQFVEEVPVQAWDQKVDIVVTPANCYICKI